ncbi:DEAD/DEAH box helicase [Catenovulum maritimum]|uniref:Helicase n=1 Tax=Catenovulum maritimum TaxID=1513271 RepID=A0A0J8JIU6_9ALTE|nr:DEAD/DEAH box helicase [Catenovulum maritimum]KMT64381.1 helicase [Catenovulum maritimum]
MKISANIQQQITEKYTEYQKLDDVEKICLKLLAVIHKPIGISKFGQILKFVGELGLFETITRKSQLAAEKRQALVQNEFIIHSKEGLKITPLLANKLTEECIIEHSLNPILHAAEQVAPVRHALYWQSASNDGFRLARDFYFSNKMAEFEQCFEFNKDPQIIDTQNQLLIELFFVPFNLDLFLSLSDTIQYQSFATWLTSNQHQGFSNLYAIDLLEQTCQQNPSNSLLKNLLAEQYLLQLKFDQFLAVIDTSDKTSYSLQLAAQYQFLTGDFEQAKVLFEQAIQAKNKITRRKKQYLNNTAGVLYKLCLLILANDQEVQLFSQIKDQIDFERSDKKSNPDLLYLSESMRWGATSLEQGKAYQIKLEAFLFLQDDNPYCFHLIQLINLICFIWSQEDKHKLNTPEISQILSSCLSFFNQAELPLFHMICQQIDAEVQQKPAVSQPKLATRLIYLPNQVHKKASWDLALDKLLALSASEQNKPGAQSNSKPSRLVWEMQLVRHNVSFKVREQKQSSKGWSKGKPIALKRLHKTPESFDYLSQADLAMCEAITVYQNWGYYNSTEYVLEGIDALTAACQLENLYLADDLSAPIELIQKEPELIINQQGQDLLLTMANLPDYLEDSASEQSKFTLVEESAERYSFTIFNPQHLKVAKIIGEGGLLIPTKAKQKVLASVAAIAPLLNIQSDIAELDTGLENVNHQAELVVNIQPYNQGLEFSCFVMPFGEQGPALKPGIGNANLTTELNGKRVATQRDLISEQDLLDQLDQHCPQFINMPDNILAIDDLESALETMEQLEQVINQDPLPFAIKLRWPKGKKIKLSKKLEAQHLQLAINKKNEWFDFTGELQVDDEEVIEIKRLLELVATNHTRFIKMDSGKILALSQDLRKKLEQLQNISEDGKFHPLASFVAEEATSGMRLKPLHGWEEQTKKMHQANKLEPLVPLNLQAELRDYQQTGFDWASRLAHWGAGACLADDMGLGKTLQALAILLDRAKLGPSLVIAPTSVCFNWQQEAIKFAPSLNIKVFANATSQQDRMDLLESLTQYDCVVISYGLLQREIDLLAKVNWNTLIADEAQALKNPLAKRTKAAYKLKAQFKIITTGTPIENNLTELWSLFRFVNPGLLGNLKRFGERFAIPIENAKEDPLAARKASQGLKTLIKPFILRRMKSQVLTELPAKTEVTIQVHLSQAEQSFYEALRQTAVENISQSSQNSAPNEQRIQMLAELVKLRQACCNPALIVPETHLPSAKLLALDKLLDELRENKHKTLIFSQFVGHLQLIKQHLEHKQISYQYLDGTTSYKDREKRVNAFQNGEGDVFLISLKAGGFGLNLTAADYVIHMDPWWNPAVEEQASDRAHRMGQQRPVTIYRLVAQNTIEEKIVALHQQKRDLAESLLEGNEQVNRLSVADMLNLLKETF